MADVRGKFYVAELNHTAGASNQGGAVVLRAVSRGAVNRSFASATPSGEIKMHVSNQAAFDLFHNKLGKEFYVDFTEYTPEAGDGHEFVLTEGNDHYNRGQCVECGGKREDH